MCMMPHYSGYSYQSTFENSKEFMGNYDNIKGKTPVQATFTQKTGISKN